VSVTVDETAAVALLQAKTWQRSFHSFMKSLGATLRLCRLQGVAATRPPLDLYSRFGAWCPSEADNTLSYLSSVSAGSR
jgi:hypothetical protein